MRLTWWGHSTALIELDGVRVLTDPVLRSRVLHLRRSAPVDAGELGRIDAVVVSHGHWDHLDLPSLDRVGRSVRVILPRGLGRLLRRRGFGDVVEVDAGEGADVGALRVHATPAAHAASRRRLGSKAPALGYVLTGSRRVYFAGDTDLFSSMAELAPLDLALLPVSGWGPRLPAGHLDPLRAAEALRLLRPRVAVPIHWGTFAPWWKRESDRGPADAFVRAAAEQAPGVDVRVPTLGEALVF